MEENRPIYTFIKGAVQKHKQERYIGFLSSKKRQLKLLASLDHDLARDLNSNKEVDGLSESEWKSPCVLYSNQGAFGKLHVSIKRVYEELPWEGGWLIISECGEFGVYRPEGRIDDELFIKI